MDASHTWAINQPKPCGKTNVKQSETKQNESANKKQKQNRESVSRSEMQHIGHSHLGHSYTIFEQSLRRTVKTIVNETNALGFQFEMHFFNCKLMYEWNLN